MLKVKNIHFKDIYSCSIEIIKGLTDKGQFQYLAKLKGPQWGTYLYTTQGPRTVSYLICPNFDSLLLGKCIFDNFNFVLKQNPDI